MRLEEKKKTVEELHEKFARSKVVIVTDFKGLNVPVMNDLRRKLRDAQIEYRVVKNTLLSLASRGTDVEGISHDFKGPCAIAMSYSDPVAPAKILTQFAKENSKLSIKIGVLKGRRMTLDDIKALSSLPPREVLLGQLLSVMNGVPTSLVRALSDVPRRMLNVLQAIREKKEQPAA